MHESISFSYLNLELGNLLRDGRHAKIETRLMFCYSIYLAHVIQIITIIMYVHSSSSS